MNCARTSSQQQQIQEEVFNLHPERKDGGQWLLGRNCEKNYYAPATYLLSKHMCLLIHICVRMYISQKLCDMAYIHFMKHVCVFTIVCVHACQLAPVQCDNNNCGNCANNSSELGQPNGCPTHKLSASAHTISRARTLLGVKLDRRVNTHTCKSSCVCVKCAWASLSKGQIHFKSIYNECCSGWGPQNKTHFFSSTLLLLDLWEVRLWISF